MNGVYLSKINKAISQERLDVLLRIISEENMKKCQRFKFREDVLRTLYGELLVRHVLCEQFLFVNKDIKLSRNEAGKPYIEECNIYFNISHAGDFVVCAFCEQPVGIDIEEIKEIDLEIAKRFFCKSEYEDLMEQKEVDRLNYFYSLWTLKESYIKWLGMGLSIPLDSFCFKITDTEISFVNSNRLMLPFFKQYYVAGYKLSLCSTNHTFPNEIKEICIEKWCFSKNS